MKRVMTTLGAGLAAIVVLGGGVGGAAPSFGESEPEFIELQHWEGQLLEGLVLGTSDCAPPTPEVEICTLSGGSARTVGTHYGQASEAFGPGTRTTYFTESCVGSDGSTGHPVVTERTGVITGQSGDQVNFSLRYETCTAPQSRFLGYWEVTGGTGRFEGASGLMSAVSPTLESGFFAISTGTLRVRADLWEDRLPTAPVAVIDPGAVGVQEGNEGQVVVEVPVALSSPATAPVTVDWATSDTGEPGVATADVDYVAASGTLTFSPGETTQTISITVNGDTEVEPPLLYGEWGLVELSNPSPNATLDDSSALGATGVFVIIDDD